MSPTVMGSHSRPAAVAGGCAGVSSAAGIVMAVMVRFRPVLVKCPRRLIKNARVAVVVDSFVKARVERAYRAGVLRADRSGRWGLTMSQREAVRKAIAI